MKSRLLWMAAGACVYACVAYVWATDWERESTRFHDRSFVPPYRGRWRKL